MILLRVNVSKSSFLKDNFNFLDQIFPDRVFLVQTRTNEDYHETHHIQINICTNFHLKQTVVRPNLSRKVISGPKQGK